jgi:Tol biopolymer transport system component/DNA-binding winged helix-turn-helix (wHTH) protein
MGRTVVTNATQDTAMVNSFPLYTPEIAAMPPTSRQGEIFRFGPFEVDPAERVLRKHGIRIKLQTQPFLLLTALLEHSGSLVTREELRRRIWPEQTFVDFEHGLNAAVTRLRHALSDSVAKPRYIETVPKCGYRFCAPVERETPEKAAGVALPPVTSPKRSFPGWMAPAGLLAATAVVLAIVLWERPASKPLASGAVPLTAFRGQEIDPALSPDGSQVAFVWNGPQQDNFDIYTMRLGSDKPVRVTADPAPDVGPTWSPDGSTIAFVRQLNADHGELLLIPASGGPEHKIASITDGEFLESPARLLSLAWSPDGSAIAASHRQPGDASERIYLFSRTGEMRPLTSPTAPLADHTPAFSSDGRFLAFTRLPGYSTAEIYILPLNSTLDPAGDPRRVTDANRWCVNPVWLPGKDRILYLEAIQPEAHKELKITTSNNRSTVGVPVLLNDEPRNIAAGPHEVVYSTLRKDTNIWRARIPAAGERPSIPKRLIASTRADDKPRYSPDGSKIAFTSSRSGTPEVWEANSDGSSLVRITNFGGPLVGHADWSPDGQWITFHARPEGQADVFRIPAAGGRVKRLTTDPADDTMPTFTRDGLSIYFGSARSGQLEIWRMPASGGPAVQITTSGGFQPSESADGKTIFYLSLDGSKILSVPFEGGPAAEVIDPVHGYPTGFAVTSGGIYYEAPPHSGEQSFVCFFNFATRTSRPLAIADRPFYLGLTVSPREPYILFDQIDDLDRDLMLLRDFRPE